MKPIAKEKKKIKVINKPRVVDEDRDPREPRPRCGGSPRDA
jgi:hypothetical protein